MNFLTPLYLAGLAAVAIPVLLHLIRRQTRANQMFSSLMFLSPSPPRVNRRSRIDNWLLLLMRAAIVALFAFAFARPFLPASADIPLDTAARFRILAIDRSASMSREDLWQQATVLADQAIGDLGPQDAIAVVAYDQDASILLDATAAQTASTRAQEAKAVLEDLKKQGISHESTQHANALQTAIDQFERYRSSSAWLPGTICEVILISDLQAGEQFGRLQTIQWPDDLVLVVKSVTAKNTSNATASLLGKVEPTEGADAAKDGNAAQGVGLASRRYRVRIDNAATSKKTAYMLEWVDSQSSKKEPIAGSFEVPVGQSRVVQVDGPTFENGSLNVMGDDVGFDNQFYFHQSRPRPSSILYVSDRKSTADGQELGYFLNKISSKSSPDLPQVSTTTNEALPKSLENPSLPSLIIANSDLRASTAQSMQKYVNDGGTLLIAIDQMPAQIEELKNWWRSMFTDQEIELSEAKVKDFLLWQNIDFRSAIFAPFNDPKSNNFAKIHFWRSRSVKFSDESDWLRLVSYDSGEGAMWQRSLGQGRIYILASGWQIADSQLALSTKFVPVLMNMIGASQKPQQSLAWLVGKNVDAAELTDVVSIQSPDGRTTAIENAIFVPDKPGLYECVMSDGKHQTAAANLVRSECQIDPLTADQFEQFGINLDRMIDRQTLEQNARQMRNTELEANQQWWRWLLVAGLVFIGLETVFSARYQTAIKS